MPDSIDEVKNRLRRSYLGKGGIHGVGVSRAKQAIRVYVSPQAEADQSDVLALMRESASPFPVIVVREDRAQIT
jgi:hypothetical protein